VLLFSSSSCPFLFAILNDGTALHNIFLCVACSGSLVVSWHVVFVLGGIGVALECIVVCHVLFWVLHGGHVCVHAYIFVYINIGLYQEQLLNAARGG
jgi:hypothetical protein